MRSFSDSNGMEWTASVQQESGPDYKGRYHLVIVGADGTEVSLDDIRWNTERTARRTLETMSEWELKRRLRAGLGRRSAASPL